ncbi:MAG TPA: hypothetical protein VGB20_04750 [bacterium]
MTPETFPLAAGTPAGSPAPYWVLAGFKLLGFVLHMVPMHVWYAGMVLVAVCAFTRHAHAARLGRRLASAMPILIALGVNFGIVPLLFIQVAYYPVFYPATIMMGWFWFSVIPMLLAAYYGVYVYAGQVRGGRVSPLGRAAGVVSAGLFLAIGFVFSNAFSLMADPARMLALYERTSVAGAVTGTGLNLADPTLFPRWLMMFGLAIMTTAVYILVETRTAARGESEDYRRWAARAASRLHGLGLVWFGAMGAWYVFGTLEARVTGAIAGTPGLLAASAASAALPVLVWALMRRAAAGPVAVWPVAAAQAAVLIANAVSRQWVQSIELAHVFRPEELRVSAQWGPMAAFLVLFAAGLAVVAWMLRQLAHPGHRSE